MPSAAILFDAALRVKTSSGTKVLAGKLSGKTMLKKSLNRQTAVKFSCHSYQGTDFSIPYLCEQI